MSWRREVVEVDVVHSLRIRLQSMFGLLLEELERERRRAVMVKLLFGFWWERRVVVGVEVEESVVVGVR